MIQLQEVHQEQEEQHQHHHHQQQQQIQQNHHACNNEDILNQIKTSVHNLYEFKTKYLNEWADKYGVLNDSMFESWMQSDTICSMISESCELMSRKSELVQLKFEQTISMLKAHESIFMHTSVSALQKAEFCYQYGKAFNAIDSDLYAGILHDTEEKDDLTCQAIQWLTKALKFNPQHTDAWCELGDSCWRQGDPVQAASHFRQALKIDAKHIEALCQLSMVLRQLPPPTAPPSRPVTINNARTTPAKQVELTTDSSSVFSQSVELAHSAVSQQPTNGFAWSVLGNALLTMFFKNFGSMTTPQLQSSSNKQALSQTDNNISCNNKAMSGSTVTKTSTTTSSPSSCQVIMNRCLAAYSQAVKDRSTALEPSFHYNRGLAWHYRDMFGKTLTCWLQAVCLDPDWPAPQNCIKRIIKFILEWKTFMQQLSEIHSCTDSCSMDMKSSDQRQQQQQQQEIDEFIVPLNPLTKLLTVNNKKNSDWSTNNNGDNQTINQSSSNYGDDKLINNNNNNNNKLTLDIKDTTALNRLLGPCCPQINSVVDQHDGKEDDKSVADMKQKASDKTSSNNKKKKRLKSAKHANSSCNTLTNSSELRLLTSVIDTSQINVGLFKDLQIGVNKNTVCVGRVYAELPADTDLAKNFLLVDAYGMPFTIRVYNIGKGKGPVRKDTIAIPNPFVEEIFIEGLILHSCITALSKLDSKYLSEDIISKLANLNKDTDTTIESDNLKEFDSTSLPPSHLSSSNSTADIHIRLIRIPLPDLLVVNGQPVGSSWTSAPVFKTVFFTGN